MDDADGLGFRFATKPLGSKIELRVNRKGKLITMPINAIAAPETRPRDTQTLSGNWPLAGISVANASPALSEELGLDIAMDGVVVTSVKSSSPADQLGLKKGDILVSIDGSAVKSAKDVLSLQRTRQYYWTLVIKRDGETLTSKIGG